MGAVARMTVRRESELPTLAKRMAQAGVDAIAVSGLCVMFKMRLAAGDEFRATECEDGLWEFAFMDGSHVSWMPPEKSGLEEVSDSDD